MTLNEKKDNLPVAVLTDYVSRCWEEIGILKASIENFKKEFTETTDFINVLQDLLDAYLICVGRLEKKLDSKKYLDITEVQKQENPEKLDTKEVKKVAKQQESTKIQESKKTKSQPFEYFVDFDTPTITAKDSELHNAWFAAYKRE